MPARVRISQVSFLSTGNLFKSRMAELVAGNVTQKPLALTQCSKFIFAACGSDIFKFSVSSTRVVAVLSSHSSEVTAVVMLPDGCLLTSAIDGSIKLWKDNRCVMTHSTGLKILGMKFCNGRIACLTSAASDSNDRCLVTFTMSNMEFTEPTTLITGAVSAFDVSTDFVACGVSTRLFIHSIARNVSREVKHKRPLTAVVINPSQDHVATADTHGIIVRWSVLAPSFWESSESTRFSGAAQHWHSTACPALTFNGGSLLSGGDEGVLCMWHSAAERKPQFMPRLGAPIRHISVSGHLACVSLVSNSIILVDLHRMKISGTITGVPAKLGNSLNFQMQQCKSSFHRYW